MAQRDQGMRMLINDEEDEEEDDDDDDDDDVDAADDGDDDEDDEDKDGEGEDEDENEDDDRLPAGNLFSGGARGDRGGSNLGLPEGEGRGLIGKFQGCQWSAYSLLKQEQLQLAQLAFVISCDNELFSAFYAVLAGHRLIVQTLFAAVTWFRRKWHCFFAT